MAVHTLAILVSLLACFCDLRGILGTSFQLYGKINVEHAGFLTLYETPSTSQASKSNWTLLISAFNAAPFSKSNVFAITDLENKIADVSAVQNGLVKLADNLAWPNEMSGVPEKIFSRPVAAVPGGFIVPTHTNGALSLIDLSVSPVPSPVDIAANPSDSTKWFYHRVIWKDMNGDGHLDAVTCRARQPFPGFSTKGEFVWFENPGTMKITPDWKPHVIGQGPDTFFTNVTLSVGNMTYDCFVMAQYFSNKLTIYWTTDETNRWVDSSKIKSRVIDGNLGHQFGVEILDLNGDGKLDILATVNDPKNGSMWAYEIPADFRTGVFKRHLLASGYKPLHSSVGSGAPGSPAILRLPSKTGTDRPQILLSGDDSGLITLFTPSNDSPSNWNYYRKTVLSVDGTVGEIALGDVTHDGSPFLFVPSYNEGKIYIYKLRP